MIKIIVIIIFYSWISLPIILAYVVCDKIETPTEFPIFPSIIYVPSEQRIFLR